MLKIKNIEIKNTENQINEKHIKSFEKLIGNSLPRDYVSWLMLYNGGAPVIENTFELIDTLHINDNYESIKYFYALRDGTTNSLEVVYKDLINRIPKELISIADDPCGNQICLGIKGKHFNKVYFWDHENEAMEANQEPWWDNVYLIANTFADFINKLFYAEVNEEEWTKNKRIVYTYHPPSSDFS